jgi:hypothetical protein
LPEARVFCFDAGTHDEKGRGGERRKEEEGRRKEKEGREKRERMESGKRKEGKEYKNLTSHRKVQSEDQEQFGSGNRGFVLGYL